MLQNFFMQMWEKKETTTPTCESQQSLGDRGKIRSPLCNRCSGFAELLLIYIPAGRLFWVGFVFSPDRQGRRCRNEMIVMAHLYTKLLSPIWKSGTKEVWEDKQKCQWRRGKAGRGCWKLSTEQNLSHQKSPTLIVTACRAFFLGWMFRERLTWVMQHFKWVAPHSSAPLGLS